MTPIRLWPGVVAVALLWLVRFAVPAVVPEAGGAAILGGVAGGVAVVIWWLFFSRVPWAERVSVIAFMAGGLFVTTQFVHESIANGMMGLMPIVLAIPILSLALVASVAASRDLSRGARRASIDGAIVVACATLTLIRTDGLTGDARSDLAWRWTPTPEQRLLAQVEGEVITAARPSVQPPRASSVEMTPAAPDAAPGAVTNELSAAVPPAPVIDPAPVKLAVEWPGYRGSGRDGVVRGVQIETDWSRSPPVEIWRRPIGPGWSSFAVRGDRIFTQEQRGDDEAVSAYSLKTGEPLWRHGSNARFWESNAGPGPRATPALGHGRVYTLGATGILNALDQRDGSLVWSRNAVSDTGATIPDWGIASSPLVVGDMLVVATAGSLAAYDAGTGAPRWLGPSGGWGYSSPHLSTIDGIAQIVLLNGSGAIGVAPADGALLWKHDWPGDGILQPVLIPGGHLLIPSGSGLASNTGMRRVAVAYGRDGWKVEERWTSMGLKPYFNDVVVHDGHAFGFDGSILACIDIDDGTRKWKGGRYGHGQLVLLPDRDVLLVLSESGELALVRAAPDRFTELARMPALEGKTWNHPVVVGDILLVRNGEEMAAFRLPPARR